MIVHIDILRQGDGSLRHRSEQYIMDPHAIPDKPP